MKLIPFDIQEVLDSEEAIAEYLNAVLEENDPELLALALREVAKARGMATVTRAAGLGEKSLYKALAPGARPRLETIMRVAGALGLRLQAVPATPSKPARRRGPARAGRPDAGARQARRLASGGVEVLGKGGMSIRALVVAAMTVAATGVTMSSSLAADPDPHRYVVPDPPRLPPGLLDALTRDMRMTPEQVEAYARKSRQAHFDLARIRQFLGDAWAAGYLHRREDSSFEVVVATTDGRFEHQIRAMHADRVVVVRYSLRELEEVHRKMLPAFLELSPKGVVTMGVDSIANRINVGVKRGSEALLGELAATANVPIEMLKVESMDALPHAGVGSGPPPRAKD